MKTKIYFRVDALNDMGRGHLVRSLALANILKEHFFCIFLSKINNEIIAEIISSTGFEYVSVPLDLDSINEAKWININFLKGDEILVLDGYQFDFNYQYELKGNAGKIVCIDDIHDIHFLADAIINHGGGIQAESYSKEENCQLFLGLDYLILRPEFFNQEQKQTTRKPIISQVMICLGGEDPNNETLKILAKCEHVPEIKTCHVIIGSGYKHKQKLDKFIENSSLDVEILHQLSAQQMVKTMQKCDTAICSPSTVSLEYLFFKGNLFLHQIADNQKHILKYLLENNLAFRLNELGKTTEKELVKSLKNQAQIIDGKSPHRLFKIFKSLESRMYCKFRKTTFYDMYTYFVWTNEEETRLQSLNSKSITFSDHYNWFSKKIISKETYLYILEYEKNSAGQIRFDIKNEIATISYSLDKEYRGKGLGKVLIKGGIQQLIKDNPRIKLIQGYVKNNNQPSIHTFKKLGFQEEKEDESQLKFIQAFS
jgi:UDP-2,4-diacetamido-2,4,6-trideoxy-beta-L-altropyranose hydrolase